MNAKQLRAQRRRQRQKQKKQQNPVPIYQKSDQPETTHTNLLNKLVSFDQLVFDSSGAALATLTGTVVKLHPAASNEPAESVLTIRIDPPSVHRLPSSNRCSDALLAGQGDFIQATVSSLLNFKHL